MSVQAFCFPWGETAIADIPLAFVDVETTGIAFPQSKITEISIVTLTGAVQEVWQTLINPGVPIPMEVVKLNGISDAVVAGQPTIKEVLPEIRKRLENRVLIAHNVPFDWAFIDGAIRETLGISLSCPHMCTLHMSRKYLSLTSNSLTSVARHLGVPLVDAHRAEADTLAVVGIFRKMMEILAARGCKVGNDLIRQGILKTAPPVNRR